MKILQNLTFDDLVDLDVAEFLEDEEMELDWKLCEVPVCELSQFAGGSWDVAWANFLKINRSEEEARERVDSITDWLKEGIDPLKRRPIVLVPDAPWDLADGYHRLAVVTHVLQFPTIIAAAGFSSTNQ